MGNNRKITFGGNPVTLLGNEIKVGDLAPDFKVLSGDLSEVSLADAKGKTIVLSVVPSVDTSVCALQTKRFNQLASEIDDTIIYTISVDLPFALSRFCAAEGIDNIKVLSDHRDLDFAMKYGFLIKEHRLLTRGIVVIDPEGKVRYVEYVEEVTNHPDYDKALEVVKAI
ncbi:MAG: thiol peroxidase [Clostridiales bacterium]|nr:thiol peroxidase [Clostridiales bacterium]